MAYLLDHLCTAAVVGVPLFCIALMGWTRGR